MKKNVLPFHTFFRDFFRCGLIGWCAEIIFTALGSLRRRDMRLAGSTSLWMFPIYGCAAFLRPIFALLKKCALPIRGFTYMVMVFAMEFFSGNLLQQKGLCPWDYGRSHYNIKRVIRLDYAPLWFCIGLLFERALTRSTHSYRTKP